ncbi:hypothetical protein BD560DRAFT_129477 [Blakeslea trispora]|nr:hypothetical protein BD560DRAFT_129477 [Blakeslea trispora]
MIDADNALSPEAVQPSEIIEQKPELSQHHKQGGVESDEEGEVKSTKSATPPPADTAQDINLTSINGSENPVILSPSSPLPVVTTTTSPPPPATIAAIEMAQAKTQAEQAVEPAPASPASVPPPPPPSAAEGVVEETKSEQDKVEEFKHAIEEALEEGEIEEGEIAE